MALLMQKLWGVMATVVVGSFLRHRQGSASSTCTRFAVSQAVCVLDAECGPGVRVWGGGSRREETGKF